MYKYYFLRQMNNTFSLHQISQTGNLDCNFITGHYKLDLIARFMERKSLNPKSQQNQIAKKLGFSSSTLQRYRKDINMFSPHRFPTNITNKRDKRFQIQTSMLNQIMNMITKTSNDLK